MGVVRLKEHPSFELMKQSDTGGFIFMQMPLWLFQDARYSNLSSDARVLYTLLYLQTHI